MGFEFGNKIWERRQNHGRAKKYESVEELWAAAVEYFEWCTENPLEEAAKVTFNGKGGTFPVDKMRAMTQAGLCNFIDIGTTTWAEYKKRDDFREVCEAIEQILYQQKFEGAASGLLNPSIIARDLGLADRKEFGGAIAILDKDDHEL